MRIYKEFFFDAAHYLPHAEQGHPNRRMHGHSFRVVVWLSGKPSPATGQLRPFDEVEQEVMSLRGELDHHLLNEVEGLSVPTLENLAVWIWEKLKAPLPELTRVEIHRASCREGCIYDGPAQE